MTSEGKRWKVLLTSAADNDLREIGNWTADHFGEVQAGRYAQTIADALTVLRAGPTVIGVKQRNDIAQGLHSLHIARNRRKGRHVVVFRIGRIEGRETIEVMRILHDSMDLARHLWSPDE